MATSLRWWLAACAGFAALLSAGEADASLVVVANAPTQVRLRICAAGAAIARVDFTIPGASVGNGVPVLGAFGGSCIAACGAGPIYIDAEARAAPANARTATLTVDSSVPMRDGLGNSIPFTDIDWVASGFAPTTIPSGAFTGGAGQVLAVWQNSRRNRQCHRFRYLNATVYTAGTYNGRVTYTLSMP